MRELNENARAVGSPVKSRMPSQARWKEAVAGEEGAGEDVADGAAHSALAFVTVVQPFATVAKIIISATPPPSV